MAVDQSDLLYLCPVCDRPFRKKQEVKNHISAAQSGGHGGMSGYKLDRPIPTRAPKEAPKPVDDWREEVEEYVDERHAKDAEIPYRHVAEELGLPNSFVAFTLRNDLDRTPVMTNGHAASSKWRWSDFTDAQQHTLLALAYFPDLTHYEIAELGMSGHSDQSSVSRMEREYLWVLSHPDFDAPIHLDEDRTDSEEGSVEYEGDVEVREAVKEVNDALDELEGDDEEDIDYSEEARNERAEAALEDMEDSEDDGLRIDEGTAYAAMCAAVEAEDFETAHDLWEAALDK